ncbi:hypothetical protein DFJ74DRAFT_763107 [Hyaloraphidium curvatum]|nr:hypothetical protein DFJ74DRAFT_763107 [Hyaloraphidium curvatum]
MASPFAALDDPTMDDATRAMILSMLQEEHAALAQQATAQAAPGPASLLVPGPAAAANAAGNAAANAVVVHGEGNRFLTYDAAVDGSLDDFLEDNKPTKVTRDEYDWISVVSPSHKPQRPDAILDAVAAAQEELAQPGTGTAKAKKVLEAARRSGVVSGKWLVFYDADGFEMNKAWARIAKATVKGELGSAAKIATKSPTESMHLICVYVEDFDNKRTVGRVKQQLDAFGLRSNSFKPDIYTYMGLMSKNDHGIPISMWKPKDVVGWAKEWEAEDKRKAKRAADDEAVDFDEDPARKEAPKAKKKKPEPLPKWKRRKRQEDLFVDSVQ